MRTTDMQASAEASAVHTSWRAKALAERLEDHAVRHSYHHFARIRAALAAAVV